MRNKLLGCVSALVLLAPAAAQAQFMNMDYQTDHFIKGLVQLDVTFVDIETPQLGPGATSRGYTTDDTFLRTNIYAQASFAGWGGYIMMPISGLIADIGSNETAIGNLELGAIKTFGFGPLKLITRFGVSIPTASDDLREIVTNLAASTARRTDLGGLDPDRLGFRLSASPQFNFLLLFARGDIGVDLYTDTGDQSRRTNTFLRLNAALGINTGMFQAAVEFTNTGQLDGVETTDEWTHTFGVSASVSFLIARIYLGFTTPLDEPFRGEYYTLSTGLEIAI